MFINECKLLLIPISKVNINYISPIKLSTKVKKDYLFSNVITLGYFRELLVNTTANLKSFKL